MRPHLARPPSARPRGTSGAARPPARRSRPTPSRSLDRSSSEAGVSLRRPQRGADTAGQPERASGVEHGLSSALDSAPARGTGAPAGRDQTQLRHSPARFIASRRRRTARAPFPSEGRQPTGGHRRGGPVLGRASGRSTLSRPPSRRYRSAEPCTLHAGLVASPELQGLARWLTDGRMAPGRRRGRTVRRRRATLTRRTDVTLWDVWGAYVRTANSGRLTNVIFTVFKLQIF